MCFNQSVSQSGKQAGRQTGRQTVCRCLSQSASQSVCQSVSQAVSQAVSQSVSQSSRQADSLSVSQSFSESVSQSTSSPGVPFVMRWKSGPLARSNDIPVLNGSVNTIDWDQNQSDLTDLTLSVRRVTGSPWIADFRCWTWPEVTASGNEIVSQAGRQAVCLSLRQSLSLSVCQSVSQSAGRVNLSWSVNLWVNSVCQSVSWTISQNSYWLLSIRRCQTVMSP